MLPQNKQQRKITQLQVACFMAAGLQNLSHLPRFLMRRHKFHALTQAHRTNARERSSARERAREWESELDARFGNILTFVSQWCLFIDFALLHNYLLNLLHLTLNERINNSPATTTHSKSMKYWISQRDATRLERSSIYLCVRAENWKSSDSA